MVGFVQHKCVLCFNVPSNKSDINFLDSKENIRKELDGLSFSILPANSICKACLALVNKRAEKLQRTVMWTAQYDNERARNSIKRCWHTA
jgi:hypothetical protein